MMWTKLDSYIDRWTGSSSWSWAVCMEWSRCCSC